MSDEYQAVSVYDMNEGRFLGYAINLIGTPKLRGTFLYRETTESEEGEEELLREDLERLNHGADMTHHWPDKDDPDFIALINDPDFMPIEYTEEEVIDDEALQALVDADEIEFEQDPVSGNINWKHPEDLPKVWAKVPLDPAAPQARLHKAAETIALRRMAADDGVDDPALDR